MMIVAPDGPNLKLDLTEVEEEMLIRENLWLSFCVDAVKCEMDERSDG